MITLTHNYHTHTARCGHAAGTDRAYVEAAVQAGIQVLGFSDHMPWWADTPGLDRSRMNISLIDDYFRSLTELKAEFAGQIELHIGFEAEYYEDLMSGQLERLRDYPCEYLILGQHFAGYADRSQYYGRPFDDPAYLETYTRQVTEGIRTGLFKYLAHPDILLYRGADEAPLLRCYEQIIQAAKDADLPVEINILGMREGRNYPTETFFRMAAENGNRAIIGIDAHAPEQLLLSEDLLARAEALVGTMPLVCSLEL